MGKVLYLNRRSKLRHKSKAALKSSMFITMCIITATIVGNIVVILTAFHISK